MTDKISFHFSYPLPAHSDHPAIEVLRRVWARSVGWMAEECKDEDEGSVFLHVSMTDGGGLYVTASTRMNRRLMADDLPHRVRNALGGYLRMPYPYPYTACTYAPPRSTVTRDADTGETVYCECTYSRELGRVEVCKIQLEE